MLAKHQIPLLRIFFFNIYLFGCIWSSLQQTESSLHCVRSFVSVCGPSSCGKWAYLLCGMWDISSPTRDQIQVPCIARRILNHWTTREVPWNVTSVSSLLHSALFWPFHCITSPVWIPLEPWCPVSFPPASGESWQRHVHLGAGGWSGVKCFPSLWCLHFLQGWRHPKPEEWLSSCGVSVVSQQMQEVSYWVWGFRRSPGNHPEWPPACSVLHQFTSCIPPVLCVWLAWVGWRQQACLWESLCMGGTQ